MCRSRIFHRVIWMRFDIMRDAVRPFATRKNTNNNTRIHAFTITFVNDSDSKSDAQNDNRSKNKNISSSYNMVKADHSWVFGYGKPTFTSLFVQTTLLLRLSDGTSSGILIHIWTETLITQYYTRGRTQTVAYLIELNLLLRGSMQTLSTATTAKNQRCEVNLLFGGRQTAKRTNEHKRRVKKKHEKEAKRP